jgi:cell division protease FtsH
VTTGASNDLHKVAEITRSMVHDYAMGAGATGQRAWIDVDMASEASRRIRDEEQRELAYQAEQAARSILETHRGKLDELAAALLEREVLDRDDLDRILGDVPRVDRRATTSLRIAAADPTPPAE